MGFQTKVNSAVALGVEGDFATTNPRASVIAVGNQLVAPVGGIKVGNFGFVNPADGTVHTAYTSGYQVGYLGRNAQALITAFLGEATLVVPAGFMLTLFDQGDFLMRFLGGATAGQNVYADETDGSPISAATAPGAVSATAIFGTTADGHGSATGGVLTISAAPGSGAYFPGDVITGTAVPAGTTIVSQLTGTIGVAGTYQLAPINGVPVAFAAATNLNVVTTQGVDVTAIGSGTLAPGDVLVSGGVVYAKVAAQLSGSAGSTGLYSIDRSVAAKASGAVTVAGGIATGYKVRSNCNPGELAIGSSWG